MKYLFLFIFSISFFIGTAQENEESNKIEFNGFVRNYMGVFTQSPNDFSIFQNTVNLEIKQQNDKIGFYANPYLYHYANKPIEWRLREMYVDFFTNKMDIRIGKQQIIWGQADGVFITDIVTPKDLSEFLLRDFNEIRTGINAVKANYYFNDENSLELVWIPQFTSTKPPGPGSNWYFTLPFPVKPTFHLEKKNIPLRLENGEFFARYSLNNSWIDLQLMGGYTWDDDPALHMMRTKDTMTGVLKIDITPEHHRMALFGGSFSTDVAGFILRGESAYYLDKYFQNPFVKEAVVQKDYLNYVVGLDKTIGDWRLSAQFIQKRILDYDEDIFFNEVENLATLLVSKSMFREKLRVEWFTYFGITHIDAFSRLRAFYMPYDQVSIEMGTNLFVNSEFDLKPGDVPGLFGRYDKNDMIYTRVKYSF